MLHVLKDNLIIRIKYKKFDRKYFNRTIKLTLKFSKRLSVTESTEVYLFSGMGGSEKKMRTNVQKIFLHTQFELESLRTTRVRFF